MTTGEQPINSEEEIILKTRRFPDLWSRGLMWLAWSAAIYFFYKWLDAVHGSKGATPATMFWIFVFGIPLIEMMIFILELRRNKTQAWSVDSRSLRFSNHGVFYGLVSVHKEIPLGEIRSIKFDAISSSLERGIRVRGKNGKTIFIPQITDRYYEAERVLRRLSERLQ